MHQRLKIGAEIATLQFMAIRIRYRELSGKLSKTASRFEILSGILVFRTESCYLGPGDLNQTARSANAGSLALTIVRIFFTAALRLCAWNKIVPLTNVSAPARAHSAAV